MAKGVAIGEMTGAALCSDRTTHVYWNLYPEMTIGHDPMLLETMAVPNITGPRQKDVRVYSPEAIRDRQTTTKEEGNMIGAAIEFRTLGGYRMYKESPKGLLAEWYRLRNYKGTAYHATPNVTGPRQNAIRDFCEAEPVEQLEPPQQPAERQPAHNLPTRGEDTLFLTWWLLMSEDSPIADIVRNVTTDLQYQDKQDLRQDIALRTWQRSLTAELAGRKARINGQAVRRLVEQWLTRNGKALRPADAQASPEDAQKARDLIEQERAAIRQEEWKREVMKLRAIDSQAKPPAPVLLFTW